MNAEFAWDKNTLPEADTVTSPHHSKHKAMVQSVKRKNGKTIWRTIWFNIRYGKSAGEVGIDMSTDLANQITINRVTLAEWESCTTQSCYNRKEDPLESRHYSGLKLTDQVVRIVERITDKMIQDSRSALM